MLTEATTICPESIEAWLALGQIFMDNDEFIEARTCFEKAQDLKLSSAMPLLRLADLEIREKRDKSFPTRVRDFFNEASKIEPNNSVLFHKWGVFENNQRNLKKASELFKKSTILDPYSSVCWQAWGQTEIRRNNLQFGISLLEKAKVIAEKSGSTVVSWILCDLAWAHQRLNTPNELIINYYEAAINSNPNDQNAIRRYAAFLEKIGREKQAYNLRKRIGKRKVWNKPHYNEPKIKKELKKKSIKDLNEGDIVKGKIISVVNFGAFVDIGVEDHALLHISEISDRFVSDVNKYISKGDVKKFKIIYLSKEELRIHLSLKQINLKVLQKK